MAHVAKLNENNEVIEVIVVSNDYEPNVEQFAIDLYGGNWKQTSYNGTIRGVFAGVGYIYDSENDVFVTPKPFSSWVQNGSFWFAPVAMPIDGKNYEWNETVGAWNELS
jgi:hypothetical protein